ncbi:MAG: type II toxin-antitoxin system RatA family toxin [Pseudomonadota bacterium]
MRAISRSALLPYPAAALFDLVADVRAYPEYLSAVHAIDVLEESPQTVVARVHAGGAGIEQTFVTRNTLERPGRIGLELVEGPFSAFEGEWRFRPLVAQDVEGARVTLDLRFEFARGGRLFAGGLSRILERAADGLVAAFSERAAQVLGSPPR